MKTIIKLILIYFAFQLIGVLLASPIMLLLNKVYGIAATLVISSLLMCWYLLKKNYIRLTPFTWSIRSLSVLFWVLILSLGTYFAAVNLNSWIELPNWMEDQFKDLSYNVLGVLGIVVVGPIAEEFLFRGAILGSLLRTKGMNPIYAILISALIFGLIHFNPAQIVYAFIIGLILAQIYYKTGSLVLCIVIHVLLNGISTMFTIYYPEADSFVEINSSFSLMYLLPVSVLMILGGLYFLNKIQTPSQWEDMDDSDCIAISNDESKD